MRATLQHAVAPASCCRRLAAGAGPRLPPRSRAPVRVQAGGRLEVALLSAESRLDTWIAAAGVGAERAARSLQACLVGLLVTLQRVVRWVRLTALALALSPSAVAQQQQGGQLAFAGAAAGGTPDGAGESAAPAQQPGSSAGAPSSSSSSAGSSLVADFFSAATTGAVEQLRHTLMDASQGIESKMSVMERTVSSVQGTLFQAAQAHSEAVRSNPQVGMWKQPSVSAVLSEEERLREAVFAQVYAELLQKDNKDISFNAQP